MFNAADASPLLLLLLLSCGCGADVLSGGWDFQEPEEFAEVPASDGGADAGIDAEAERDDEPEPVVPIERICDGNLPPEMPVSEAGVDALAYTLAIGPDGCPHVAWSADNIIHYARWDGATWLQEAAYGPSHWRTALDIGRDGRPTLLVSHNNEPRVLRLQRSDDGAWVEREEVTNRWSWGMRFIPVAPNRKVLLTYTANKQYIGEDLALRVVMREDGDWSETRIVDFGISFHPLTLAVDSLGRGVVPILENKGYGPSDQDTNLWVATSTNSSLTAWEAARIDTAGFNQFRSASIVSVRETPHIIAVAEVRESDGERALLHLQPEGESLWRTEQFASCSNRVCGGYIRAAADSRGRIHALFEFGEPDERRLRYALLDEGRWSFQDLGRYSNVQAALEVDPVTDAVHVVAARREGPQVRNLMYIPLSAPPPAAP